MAITSFTENLKKAVRTMDHGDPIKGLFQCYKCEHWYDGKESNVFVNDTIHCIHIHLCNACGNLESFFRRALISAL